MYSFGEPVECVISDTTISGVAESDAGLKRNFKEKTFRPVLPFHPAGATAREVIDTDAFRPKAIWGFNGTERPGAVFLAAARCRT